jgi:hypothetical protein
LPDERTPEMAAKPGYFSMPSQAFKRRHRNPENRELQGPGCHKKHAGPTHGFDAKQHSKIDVSS